MKHLILGSEGQIGTHLTNYLKQRKVEVIEFDILRSKDEDLRIHNNEFLKAKMKECNFVHFLAFDVGGSEYMKKYQDTFDFISNNIKIMNTVFDFLKNNKKPFIFASSQMSNMTHSTYGRLKAIGENYTITLGGVIVKFWNVYGFEKDPDKTHVITDFINKANNENIIKMKTSGQEERQFLYGDDAAEALFNLSNNYNIIDRRKFLHITNFKWTKIIDIAKIVSKKFNNCPVIPSQDKDDIQKGIKNEPDKYITEFWQPQTELGDGIKKVISYITA